MNVLQLYYVYGNYIWQLLWMSSTMNVLHFGCPPLWTFNHYGLVMFIFWNFKFFYYINWFFSTRLLVCKLWQWWQTTTTTSTMHQHQPGWMRTTTMTMNTHHYCLVMFIFWKFKFFYSPNWFFSTSLLVWIMMTNNYNYQHHAQWWMAISYIFYVLNLPTDNNSTTTMEGWWGKMAQETFTHLLGCSMVFPWYVLFSYY